MFVDATNIVEVEDEDEIVYQYTIYNSAFEVILSAEDLDIMEMDDYYLAGDPDGNFYVLVK